MPAAKLNSTELQKILGFQENEITEFRIYRKLSEVEKSKHNKKVLASISRDELRHYNFWKSLSKREVQPATLKVWKYFLLSRIFGVTFGIKLMERGEESAQQAYRAISKKIPEAKKIAAEEDEHEQELIAMVDEERLKYVGSIVLGLNDALVELTGALAGMTFALQNASIIAVAGLITGIAASLSMAASEYLSTKTEKTGKNPLKASVYTGLAYIVTVVFLILPFFLLPDLYLSLGAMLLNAVIVIFLFTFYISVAKDMPFKKHFIEMVSISLGVAAVSFVIGFLIRIFLNIEI